MPESSELPLACSVRGCGLPLVSDGKSWRCGGGHSFDQARSGYLNLLQPNDRRSLAAGDSKATVAARRALLERGFGAALRLGLVESIETFEIQRGAIVLDLGAGDGFYLGALCGAFGFRGLGIDLSAYAVESAARRFPEHTWLVANADRRLPILDASVDWLLSVDGRRPVEEIARVLKPAGRVVVAIPAANDLKELRGAVLESVTHMEGADRVLAEFGPKFTLLARRTVEQTMVLDTGGLAQLAASTYRCARQSEAQKLHDLASLTVTTAHDVLVLAPHAGRSGSTTSRLP